MSQQQEEGQPDSGHATCAVQTKVSTVRDIALNPLDAIEVHAGCDDFRCRRCMEASDILCGVLVRLTEDEVGDVLGKYHTWLRKNGINPETDGGWWSRDALSNANVLRFAGRNPEALSTDPAFVDWVTERFGEEQSGVSPLAFSQMSEAWNAAKAST